MHASGPGWSDPAPSARGDSLRESAEVGGAGRPCLQGWETQGTPYAAAVALPLAVQREGQPRLGVASDGLGCREPSCLGDSLRWPAQVFACEDPS